MRNRWPVFLLILGLTLGGCRSMFTPVTSPMPLHQDVGEVHVAGQKALDGPERGFVSVTPAPHVIVYGRYLQSPSVTSFYEGGAGTYARLNDPVASSPLLFEAMVGWGRGSIQMSGVGAGTDPGNATTSLFFPFLAFGPQPAPYRLTGTVERRSLQLTLGGLHHFDGSSVSAEVGGGVRASRIGFSNLRSTGPSIASAGQLYALEPGATGRLDFGGVGIEASGGLSIPLSTFNDQNPDVNPLGNVHVGLGLTLDPVRLFTSD